MHSSGWAASLNTTALRGRRHDAALSRQPAAGADRRRTRLSTPPTGALYWQGTETDQDTYEVRRAVPPRTPPVQLDRDVRLRREHARRSSSRRVKSLGSGSLVHDVVYGIEATRSELEELRDGLQTNLTTGATTPTILGETFPLRDLPLSTVVEVGAFVQDEMRLDGLALDARARRCASTTTISRREADRIYREDNPSTSPGRTSTKLSFAPKLGATYRINDRLGVFFQYAHGFRSPPPEDVNIGLEIPLFNIRAIPNPDLQPETSDGFEAGPAADGCARGADRQRLPDRVQRLHRVEGEPRRRSGDRRDAVPVAERRRGADLRCRIRCARRRVGAGRRGSQGWTGRLAARGRAATTSRATSRSTRSIRRGWCSACDTTRRRRAGDRNSR